jgi:hypothetical protein
MKENRKKLKSVKYRILFALCLCDLVNSLVFVLWSLPIPKGTPGVWGAMGNKASCDAQGVFFQFGNIGSFYNAALALYFYKSLCASMKDEQIAKRYERMDTYCVHWVVFGHCNCGLVAGLVLFSWFGVLDGSRAASMPPKRRC